MRPDECRRRSVKCHLGGARRGEWEEKEGTKGEAGGRQGEKKKCVGTAAHLLRLVSTRSISGLL